MKKKLMLSVALAAAFSISAIGWPAISQAAPLDELARISVNRDGDNFQYWNKDSSSYKALIAYVKDVTNPNSKNFIPVEDRIAVFDCDGTLACETDPYIMEYMLPIRYVFEHPEQFSREEQIRAEMFNRVIRSGKLTPELNKEFAGWLTKIMAGKTQREYHAILQHQFAQPSEGFTNMTEKEALYLPMVEAVSYLQANDFKIFIVSLCEREMLREKLAGAVPIPSENIIGSDFAYRWKSQNTHQQQEYLPALHDELVIDDHFVDSYLDIVKATKIQREIGKQPVLAFGNSSGDLSMFSYTRQNHYKNASFALLCDDLKREYGNTEKAARMRQAAEKMGVIPVSMKDDFLTIYGDNVVKITSGREQAK